MRRRLRAQENILQSSSLERAKFMEGASWATNKGQVEASKCASKLKNYEMEFDRRAAACIRDPSVLEVDG